MGKAFSGLKQYGNLYFAFSMYKIGDVVEMMKCYQYEWLDILDKVPKNNLNIYW